MNSKTYLALGDSYTIGQSVSENNRFPEKLVVQLTQKGNLFQAPKIIAQTGWRTDQLMQAIKSENLSATFDLVTLLIGVNNEFQGGTIAQFETELNELCLEAIKLANGKNENVYLLTIPNYGFTQYGNHRKASITARIDLFNASVIKIANQNKLKIVDVTSISLQGLMDPELVTTDGLHPSGKMYDAWVRSILLKMEGNN